MIGLLRVGVVGHRAGDVGLGGVPLSGYGSDGIGIVGIEGVLIEADEFGLAEGV